MPPLPKIKNKKEAKFGLTFRTWLSKNAMPSGAYELKQTSTNSIPFNIVSESQISALLQAKSSKGLIFKPSDDTRGTKPCDYLYLRNACAWIVIKYPKSIEFIAIDTFVLESERSKRKNLTAARAHEIATISIKL